MLALYLERVLCVWKHDKLREAGAQEMGGVGDEVDNGLEADYAGPGMSRYGCRFYPLGSGNRGF